MLTENSEICTTDIIKAYEHRSWGLFYFKCSIKTGGLPSQSLAA